MGRRTLIAAAGAVLLAGAIAAAPSCSGSGGPRTIPRIDGGPTCEQGSGACADGTACVNGVCVPTCPPGSVCPAGQYCENPARAVEQVCAPVTAIACRNTLDCPAPQTCDLFQGLCTTLELLADGGRGACAPAARAGDGCGPGAVCYPFQQPGTFRCIALPACNEDGGCPVGALGAACNDFADGGQYFAGKQRLCLGAYCLQGTDCPASLARCVRPVFADGGVDLLGFCSSGSAGSPCAGDADCTPPSTCGGASPTKMGQCG